MPLSSSPRTNEMPAKKKLLHGNSQLKRGGIDNTKTLNQDPERKRDFDQFNSSKRFVEPIFKQKSSPNSVKRSPKRMQKAI